LSFSRPSSPLKDASAIITPPIETYHHCYIAIATELAIMIILSSFRVATCFKLFTANLYCCTSKILIFSCILWNPNWMLWWVMFEGYGRKELGYGKLFNRYG
jgi:hypothetical protein